MVFLKGLNPLNLQKRFNSFMKRYKGARDVKLDTHGGLIDDERDEGVNLSEKLDKMCPYFERTHALYGSKPKVSRYVLANIGVENGNLIHLKDEDEVLDKEDEIYWYIKDHSRSECMCPSTPTEILGGEVEMDNLSWL
jgi:hypothetical protein